MDNRTKILAVALDAFSARGYEAVGIAEIVKGAGITKPTLYHYFGSKLGLLEEVLGPYNQTLRKRLGSACEDSGDVPRTINRIARTYFDAASSHPKHFRLQHSLLYAAPDSAPAQLALRFAKDQFEIVERFFERASDAHGNMRGRHRAYTLTLLSMLSSYTLMALQGHAKLDKDLAFRAVHQFMHGIFS